MTTKITPELVREWLGDNSGKKILFHQADSDVSLNVIMLTDLAHAYLRQAEALEVAKEALQYYEKYNGEKIPAAFEGGKVVGYAYPNYRARNALQRIDAIMKEGE